MSIKAILSAVRRGVKRSKETCKKECIKETLWTLWKSGAPGVFIDQKPQPPTLDLSDALGSDIDTDRFVVVFDEETSEVSDEDLTKGIKGQVVELPA